MAARKEAHIEFDEMKGPTGLTIVYEPKQDGGVAVQAVSDTAPLLEVVFRKENVDEAHILYMEVTELLTSRAKINQDPKEIRSAAERLFALFRGEKPTFPAASAQKPIQLIGEYPPNPGKQIEIDVDGVTYERLPIKTRTITLADTDIVPLAKEYIKPHLKEGDIVFVSEKALTITQGRIVDFSTIHPTSFARFLARHVGTQYGTEEFHGFGHGTDLAMQLFIEEAGYLRVLFAAVVAALTRPLGVRGLFYRICGMRAKSIDCPMSFLILEYAHSAKLAPNKPSEAARKMREVLCGHEVVILDANYRGAFSLGKSTKAISERFIGKLFRDNPLGQSDEMTPFCIVRRAD